MLAERASVLSIQNRDPSKVDSLQHDTEDIQFLRVYLAMGRDTRPGSFQQIVGISIPGLVAACIDDPDFDWCIESTPQA